MFLRRLAGVPKSRMVESLVRIPVSRAPIRNLNEIRFNPSAQNILQRLRWPKPLETHEIEEVRKITSTYSDTHAVLEPLMPSRRLPLMVSLGKNYFKERVKSGDDLEKLLDLLLPKQRLEFLEKHFDLEYLQTLNFRNFKIILSLAPQRRIHFLRLFDEEALKKIFSNFNNLMLTLKVLNDKEQLELLTKLGAEIIEKFVDQGVLINTKNLCDIFAATDISIHPFLLNMYREIIFKHVEDVQSLCGMLETLDDFGQTALLLIIGRNKLATFALKYDFNVLGVSPNFASFFNPVFNNKPTIDPDLLNVLSDNNQELLNKMLNRPLVEPIMFHPGKMDLY